MQRVKAIASAKRAARNGMKKSREQIEALRKKFETETDPGRASKYAERLNRINGEYSHHERAYMELLDLGARLSYDERLALSRMEGRKYGRPRKDS